MSEDNTDPPVTRAHIQAQAWALATEARRLIRLTTGLADLTRSLCYQVSQLREVAGEDAIPTDGYGPTPPGPARDCPQVDAWREGPPY